MEKQPQALDRGRAEHHQAGLAVVMLTGARVDPLHPRGAAAAVIHLHVAHHRLALQVHPARGQCGFECSPLGGGARPGPIGWLAQRKAAGGDQRQVELALDAALQVLLRRCERQGRLGCARGVGQLGQPIALSVDLQQCFELLVEGRQIGMADRPGAAMAIALGCLEFGVGEAQGDAAPGEALAAHLAAAGPEERLVFRGAVGVLPFVDVEIGIGLPVAGVLGRQALPPAAHGGQALEAVDRLTAEGAGGAQLRAGFEHQHLQAGPGEGEGRHAAAGAAAHHDRVAHQEGVAVRSLVRFASTLRSASRPSPIRSTLSHTRAAATISGWLVLGAVWATAAAGLGAGFLAGVLTLGSLTVGALFMGW